MSNPTTKPFFSPKFYLSLIFTCLFSLSTSKLPFWGPQNTQSFPIKHYNISLEDSYEQRWSQIMTENKNEVMTLVNLALELYAPQGTPDLPESVLQNYNSDFADEITAVAKILNTTVSNVFWLNVMYEAYAYCTSIVVQDENNFVFHGRNLDYSITTPIAKVFFQIDYYQGGEILFRCNTLGGFVGFITGEKPGKFAISANQRTSREVNSALYWDRVLGRGINFFEVFFNKRQGILLVIRSVFEKANSYQEALSILVETPIIAPAYYIISGVNSNEGAVVTMDRDKAASVATLNVQQGTWFLVQTNSDRDVPDPDGRRLAAEERIFTIGRRAITMQSLLDDVLALYPNNNEITIGSAVFSAKIDYFNMTLWI